MIATPNRTTIRDADGRARVLIENRSEAGPVLVVYDPHGRPVAGLSLGDQDEAVITLVDAAGFPRVALTLADAEPMVVSLDAAGRPTLVRRILDRPPETSPFILSPN